MIIQVLSFVVSDMRTLVTPILFVQADSLESGRALLAPATTNTRMLSKESVHPKIPIFWLRRVWETTESDSGGAVSRATGRHW